MPNTNNVPWLSRANYLWWFFTLAREKILKIMIMTCFTVLLILFSPCLRQQKEHDFLVMSSRFWISVAPTFWLSRLSESVLLMKVKCFSQISMVLEIYVKTTSNWNCQFLYSEISWNKTRKLYMSHVAVFIPQ